MKAITLKLCTLVSRSDSGRTPHISILINQTLKGLSELAYSTTGNGYYLVDGKGFFEELEVLTFEEEGYRAD